MTKQSEVLCRWCDHPLVVFKFRRHSVFACDNPRCYLFRGRQGIIPRVDIDDEPRGLTTARVLYPNKDEYNANAKENYHYARSLGIACGVARDFRHKGKEAIEKAAREIVRA